MRACFTVAVLVLGSAGAVACAQKAHRAPVEPAPRAIDYINEAPPPTSRRYVPEVETEHDERGEPPPMPMEEAPSTVNATYVAPSATEELPPGYKIDSLYTRNYSQPYILQRLTERTYFFERQYYASTFYVGDQGVLLFDPLEARGEHILAAIAEVTKLPVTMVVYSHGHADHIGGVQTILDASKKAGVAKVRIVASRATVDEMALLGSALPKPTDIVGWPEGSITFEGIVVRFHGFERAAHSGDHGAWLIASEKVVHLADLVNPDQPPFYAFGGAETFAWYESNLDELGKLDWTFLVGGHGNVGSRADLDFYRAFVGDLKQAVAAALKEVPWGIGVDPARINAHTYYMPAWLSAVSKHATDRMRPKYGRYYGFEASTPRNAEMVAMSMFSYR